MTRLLLFIMLASIIKASAEGFVETTDNSKESVEISQDGAAHGMSQRRSNLGILKQVSVLSDENKRLRTEIEELKQAIKDQSAESLAEKRKLVQAEIDATKARQLAAEAEAAVLAEKTRAAVEALHRVEQEQRVAAEASDIARRTIEERRLAAESEARAMEHKRLVAESAERKAKSDAEAAVLRLKQLELEEKIALSRTMESLNNRIAKESEAAATISLAENHKEERLLTEAKVKVAEAELLLVKEQSKKAHEEAERQLALQRQLQEEESARRREEVALADKLARQRDVESSSRQEELQRLKAEEDRKTALAQISAQAEADRRRERDNEDIKLRALQAAAQAEAQKWEQLIKATATTLGSAIDILLQHYLKEVIGAGLAIIAGYFLAREIAIGTRKIVQRLVGQPSLVRETSRRSGLLAPVRSLCMCCRSASSSEELTKGVVLPAPVMQRIMAVARSTTNARRNHAPLRHVMFYGPPGTGKTLVAQKLAKACGLDYAIMSGGDVAPLGPKAVSEMNTLFEWARSSQSGLILFIDEAEAFLGSRKHTHPSENLKNVLSTILHHTGSQDSNLMLILATNRPEDLDDAILDRVDDAIFFPEPGPLERLSLGRLYFYKYITCHSQFKATASPATPIPGETHSSGCCASRPRILIAEDVSISELDAILHRAEGFSGRRIAKLMLTMQALAFGSDADQPTLTVKLMKEALGRERQGVVGGQNVDIDRSSSPQLSNNSDASTSVRHDPIDLDARASAVDPLSPETVAGRRSVKATR